MCSLFADPPCPPFHHFPPKGPILSSDRVTSLSEAPPYFLILLDQAQVLSSDPLLASTPSAVLSVPPLSLGRTQPLLLFDIKSGWAARLFHSENYMVGISVLIL